MKYRKNKFINGYPWKRGNRYGYFVATLKAEEKRKAELEAAHQNLVNVLSAIADKKFNEFWNSEKAVLENMRRELLELGKVPNMLSTQAVIQYCVKLFDITSRAQDSLKDGMLHVAPAEKQQVADEFNNDLYYSARHTINDLRNDSVLGPVPYWNTTLPGTPINEETIMFGPEIGFPRKPVSYWLKLSKKKKVYIEQTTAYSKGKLSKFVAVWATEALVRNGVHHFCKVASESLLREVNELLDYPNNSEVI